MVRVQDLAVSYASNTLALVHPKFRLSHRDQNDTVSSPKIRCAPARSSRAKLAVTDLAEPFAARSIEPSLGYISTDLRHNPTRDLLLQTMKKHNKDDFEIYFLALDRVRFVCQLFSRPVLSALYAGQRVRRRLRGHFRRFERDTIPEGCCGHQRAGHRHTHQHNGQHPSLRHKDPQLPLNPGSLRAGADGSVVPRRWTQPELLPGVPGRWLPRHDRDEASELRCQRSGD